MKHHKGFREAHPRANVEEVIKAAFEPDSDEDHRDSVSNADHATWTIRYLPDGQDDIDLAVRFLEIDRQLPRSKASIEALTSTPVWR